jgi:hypothetical protein
MQKLPALLVLLMVAAINKHSFSQDTLKNDSTREHALKVYFYCPACDMDFVRKEITFVNYVRDQKDAQLYILESSMQNGSGGSEYSIYFIGQKEFKGRNDTLKFSTSPNNTPDEARKMGNQILKEGMMYYVAHTPLAKDVTIDYATKEAPAEIKDPWKSWVYTINGSSYFNGQQDVKVENLYGSLDASKTTEKFRTDISAYYNYYDGKYQISDSSSVNCSFNNKGFNWLAVKSLGEHWSAGGFACVNASTFSNIKLHYALFPAVEYNLYKYSESTRHQLRFLYQIGGNYFQYLDTTIYNKVKQTLFTHTLTIAYKVIEKWGSISTSLSSNQYLYDLTKYDLALNTSLNVRIFKGLSFNVNGQVALVHDQLSLPAAGATEAEILTGVELLASTYTYWINAGLTYTFGSIYNNVVNPRFAN